MMTVLVVFESMFGNTELIANAVAEGLARHLPVQQVEVGAAPAVVGGEVELLVVGGPTHAFGLSRPGTRQSAAQQAQAGLVSAGIGLREWLGALHKGAADGAVAAFDTRISRPRLPGSAASAADKRLRRLGFQSAAPPTSFYVEGTTGPLPDGEIERARRWGRGAGGGAGRRRATAPTGQSGSIWGLPPAGRPSWRMLRAKTPRTSSRVRMPMGRPAASTTGTRLTPAWSMDRTAAASGASARAETGSAVISSRTR
jgi:hypothetical protein